MKQYKSIAQQATDIDEKSNTVVVYYAAFGNVDNGGDMIMPSAFTKTIQERGPQGKDLIYHFKNHSEAISKPKELIADSYGLKAVVSFPNTTKGRDTIEEYKFGMWKYHSIGYSTVRQHKSKAANELHELKLFEGGHVTWPMNEGAITETVDLKAMQDFINKSNATDEAIQLMQKLLQEFTELKSLITEPVKPTLPNKKEMLSVFEQFKTTL
jgi:HK97 family phage prohead protease